MKLTKKSALVGGSLLALVAIGIGVKLVFFPGIKEAYFSTEARGLQRAPAGLAIIRSTHFPFLHGKGILYAEAPKRVGNGYWIMGRNAPLRAVIGVAFGANPSHVVLPVEAPNRNFDFLVTTADKQNESLQAAIRRKFDYVAQRENRDTAVLALKVVDARLPGLVKSGDGERPNVNFLDYEIQFTHCPVAILVRLLDQNLPTPVIDETGLTDAYNFKVRWNSRMQQRMQNGEIDREGVNQMLAGLGLALEPDTASLEMLVVKKAK